MDDVERPRANDGWDAPKKASTEAEKASPTRIEKGDPYEDSFLVPITTAEREAFLVEMSETVYGIAVIDEKKKAYAKERQAEIDAKYARITEISSAVRSGVVEKRLKVCDHTILSLGVLRTVREDSGEIVFERALDPEERQADLFPKDAPELALEHVAALNGDAPKPKRKRRTKAEMAAARAPGDKPGDKPVDASSFDGGAPKPKQRGRKAKAAP